MANDSVLIVDDSEIDQFLTKHMLENCDNELDILQAFDGQEALEILSDLTMPPKVIFLDINMPRMNGHEFLAEYINFEQQTDTIIMLTSSDLPKDKEQALAYPTVKEYFLKPLEQDELSAVIR